MTTAAITARRLADNAEPALKPNHLQIVSEKPLYSRKPLNLPDPQEHSSDDDLGNIVGAIVELVGSVASTLSEHQGISEGSSTGGNVHGCTTSEIETAHLENPACTVPCPAGNGVIDHGGPNEREDHGGRQSTTLSCSSNGQSNCDGSEHALVHSEQQIGDFARPDRRCTKDVAEAKIFHVTEEFTRSVRECKGITPKEPLEGDQGRGCDGEPDKREGRLASGETRVEETKDIY